MLVFVCDSSDMFCFSTLHMSSIFWNYLWLDCDNFLDFHSCNGSVRILPFCLFFCGIALLRDEYFVHVCEL